MRDAFRDEVEAAAAKDDRIVLLSADIGNRMFNDYISKFPDRFYNCGVAEANMTSMASGLAVSGLKPVTYTIAAFNTVRCLEQIRVDLCYHNLPVVVVGVGAGLSYSALNATHHACEDIAMLRVLPNMAVLCPADPMEVKSVFRAALEYDGPAYIRLGKKGEPEEYESPPPFTVGGSIPVQDGTDVCLLSVGVMLPVVKQAAKQLAAKGISARIVSCPSVKPLDEKLLVEIFATYPVISTIEEHSLVGGFGAAVAEWLADRAPMKARLLRIALRDEFIYKAGNQTYAREYHNLTSDAIAVRVAEMLHQVKV